MQGSYFILSGIHGAGYDVCMQQHLLLLLSLLSAHLCRAPRGWPVLGMCVLMAACTVGLAAMCDVPSKLPVWLYSYIKQQSTDSVWFNRQNRLSMLCCLEWAKKAMDVLIRITTKLTCSTSQPGDHSRLQLAWKCAGACVCAQACLVTLRVQLMVWPSRFSTKSCPRSREADCTRAGLGPGLRARPCAVCRQCWLQLPGCDV
jgi:hypothetical protein